MDDDDLGLAGGGPIHGGADSRYETALLGDVPELYGIREAGPVMAGEQRRAMATNPGIADLGEGDPDDFLAQPSYTGVAGPSQGVQPTHVFRQPIPATDTVLDFS